MEPMQGLPLFTPCISSGVFLGRPYRAFSGVGLTQGKRAPCGRLPWAILGRAFGAKNQSQQKMAVINE
jgi:hypothetical protein